MTVKSRLLEILEKEKGETLSGEKLAEELHCTRAAIWKAVKSLREEGYMIEAGPNKGYMLVKGMIDFPLKQYGLFLSVSGGLYQSLSGSGFYEPCSESGCYYRRSRSWKLRAGGMPEGRTWPAGTQFLFTAGCRNLPECDPRTERQSSGESASDCRGGSGSLQSSKENYRVELDIKWVNDLYHNGKSLRHFLQKQSQTLRVALLNLLWSESG